MDLQEAVDIKAKVSDAVIEVFDTMLSMSIEPVDEVPEERPTSERIVGAVNFAGEVMGLITIDVSRQFSQVMTASMLDVEVDEIEGPDPVKDLLGEISNIVGGNLKSAFLDAGYDCSISTPSITAGSDFTIESLNMKTFERFVFQSGTDQVWVEVGLKAQKGTAEAADGASAEQGAGDVPKNFEVIGKLDLKATVSESLVDVFDTMLSMPVEIVTGDLPESSGDGRMVGSVNFAGEIMGIVTIGVTESFSRMMTANMLDIEIDEIESDDEIKDLLGEISNIVGGGLKSVFTDAGVACSLSPPSITAGRDFRIESLNMESYDRFAFRFQEHTGVVEVGVKGLEALKQDAGDRAEAPDSAAVPESEDAKSEMQTAPEAPEAPAAEPSPAAATKTPADGPASLAPDDRPAGSTEKADIPPPATPVTDAQPPAAAPQKPPAAAPQHRAVAAPAGGPPRENLDFVLDIPLEISVELGRTRMKLNDVLGLHQGSVVELAKLEGEPVDILANDKVIAKGEVVVENEKYGIRITEIVSRMDRIKSLK